MRFSFYTNPHTDACECSRALFLSEIEHPKLADKVARVRKLLAEGKAEEAARLKASLPAVTWQSLSTDGSHKAASMLPNSLYMLDIDGVENPRQFYRDAVATLLNAPAEATLDELQQSEPFAALREELGIYVVHVTPSGHGLRIVAQRRDMALQTIAANQAWLAERLGVVSYDVACKDMSRLAFLCPRTDFLYLDLGLWDLTDNVPFAADPAFPKATAKANANATANANAPAEHVRTFTKEQQEYRYNGTLISEIADKWVEERGVPQQGERNNFYMKMARMFRNITDDNVGVMLCQLPSLGLDIQERERCVEHATARPVNGDMPYVFMRFLIDNGYRLAAEPAARLVEVVTEVGEVPEEDDDLLFDANEKYPLLPPVFKEFCSLYPKEFAYPAIVALLPVLGTLATRLRATYIDGRVQTTSFIGVIFAPPASGKSFARDIVSICCKDLLAHDKMSVTKEKLWKREMKVKRNAENPPEEPPPPYRMVQPVISVPRLLERQEDACGLHQFSFTEEIDTLKKSNAGGSYAQKSDLYRQAFDNAEYGQDYMSLDTFTGSVKLYYNILMLGTPNQLYQFFNDAENGLVSRCCFAEIVNQEFASIPFFRSLTPKQMENITAVLNRFEAMTYTRKNAMSDDYVVNPEVDIDSKMEFLRKPLVKWLETQRIACMQEGNISKDIFRRRSAVKAFRLAMICVGMFDNITPAREKMITDFALWFADKDLLHIEKAFGGMLREQTSKHKERDNKLVNLYESLPSTFSLNDLYAQMRQQNRVGNPSYTIGIWKKAGLIEKTGQSTFNKVTKKSKK